MTNIHGLLELFGTSGPSTSGFAFGRWLIASTLGAVVACLLVDGQSGSFPSLGSAPPF